jgi:hypothetical protein
VASKTTKGSFSAVAKNLRRLKEQASREIKATFQVTYTAPYAVYVHEDLTAKHPNGGQAKFLEQPMREHASKMSQMIKNLIQKEGQSLRTALLIVGHWLLQESKKLVPVDSGKLKDSGKVSIVHKS